MAARLSSLFIVVSILLIPASVPVARASIVTEGPYTITPAKPGVDTIFAFDLFDSALGTLAGVSFDFNFQFRPGLQFFNTGDDAATFVNARVDVMGAGVRLFDGTLLDPGTLSYSLASGTAQPGTKTTFPDPVATPVQHSIQIPSGDFGAFLGPGTGTRTLVFSAPHYMVSADFASGNAEDVFVGGATLTSGSATVVYNYTPKGFPGNIGGADDTVPEPATLGLLASGVGLLAIAIRTRRS